MASHPQSIPPEQHYLLSQHSPRLPFLNCTLPQLDTSPPCRFPSEDIRSVGAQRPRSREQPMSKQAKAIDLPVLSPDPVEADGRDGAAKASESGATQPPADAVGPGPGAQWHAHGFPAVSRHRFLTSAEWTTIATGIGGVSDVEGHKPVHPTSSLWPPRGMPRGLVVRWGLMVGQLLIGAAVTSLGPMSMKDGTPITILGAINTVVAGLLALLHNSGLPDRYRYDMAQFEELEDRIKEVLDSGIAPIDMTTDQVLAECFDLFRMAKATVTANMPVSYNAGKLLQSSAGSAEPKAPGPMAEPGMSASAPRTSAAAASAARMSASAAPRVSASSPADSPAVGGADKKK
ncbi:hypothetical protein XA68_12280 [Ophiocordyceps unilateralis]|uniref:SMODS and SLOG-associating 2TM effector domain-containing protein n=1 Tax=Ophiocordyceps unilateralis TaxID=268505 RepID=A0A2A9PEN9_OPHUN|nr:hypothetical protein XA68_12280 [Ophiocordyceps unilateralis]